MDTQVFALLLLAHALADFALGDLLPGGRERADRLHRGGAGAADLLAHAVTVAATFGLFVVPYVAEGSWVVIALVVTAHVVIDVVRAALDRENDRRLPLFLVQQAAHCVVLAVAARFAMSAARERMNFGDPAPTLLETMLPLPIAAHGAILVAAWILAARAGGYVVAMTLEACRATPPSDGLEIDVAPRLGRTIGVLERLVVVTLSFVGAWAGIGLILAAKSVARFKELESRAFSEYYLIGTLSSVLVAILVGLGARLLLAAI